MGVGGLFRIATGKGMGKKEMIIQIAIWNVRTMLQIGKNEWCMDEVEEDVSILAIKNRQAVVRDRRIWRTIVVEAKVHKAL